MEYIVGVLCLVCFALVVVVFILFCAFENFVTFQNERNEQFRTGFLDVLKQLEGIDTDLETHIKNYDHYTNLNNINISHLEKSDKLQSDSHIKLIELLRKYYNVV